MPSRSVIPLLVGMMLLTGVCNTLLTKYQDMQCVANCSPHSPGKRKNFEQPVWQTAQMFVGEMGCWLVVAGSAIYQRLRPSTKAHYEPIDGQAHTTDGSTLEDEETVTSAEALAKPLEVDHSGRRPLKGWGVLLLALPTTCDIIGTTLMNVGLLFVAASIYQMTRGALVLFVGLFSFIFLKRRLMPYKWAALLIVVAGVAIVGLAGVIEQKKTPIPGTEEPTRRLRDLVRRAVTAVAIASPTPPAQTILGVVIIAAAQIFTASQYVLEESIMARYSPSALAVVGWEGTFGLVFTLLFMLIMHVSYGNTPAGHGGYFDARSGWAEMTQNRSVGITSLMIMVSIGGFNFFGLSVTRSVSATSRSTIDTSRTLFIWIVSLGLGWESFKWLQVLGFAGLVYGTFLFNDIVRPPSFGRSRNQEQQGELLPERPIEHN